MRGQAIAAQLFAGSRVPSGDHDRAARLLARSAELAAGSEFTWWQGVTLLELAELELERGRSGKGEQHARESLAPLAKVGDRQNVLYALALLARVARKTVARHAPDDCGARSRLKRLADRSVRGSVIASSAAPRARAAGDAFDAARAEGRVLALADAIAFAISD